EKKMSDLNKLVDNVTSSILNKEKTKEELGVRQSPRMKEAKEGKIVTKKDKIANIEIMNEKGYRQSEAIRCFQKLPHLNGLDHNKHEGNIVIISQGGNAEYSFWEVFQSFS
ncbi:hypothetical protein FRX31_014336, partial [Thalictrum thalictroides]